METNKVVKICESRGLNPLEYLPPPAGYNKPLTPFSITDILSKPTFQRALPRVHRVRVSERARQSITITRQSITLVAHTSPLSALQELASKTFRGLELGVLQAAEGRNGLSLFERREAPSKRRKSRTAFSNQQLYELEKRFLHQKYLSPADRDQIAHQLALSNAQVITWFQNRRAKLKRDLEEMKADVESVASTGLAALDKISKLSAVETCASTEPLGVPVSERLPPLGHGYKSAHKLSLSPMSSLSDHTSQQCSEDEEEEINVDI
ncbi:hypothetical protein DNTS_029275 [Danionella cerebrum]|uniref:Homeobox domain-containing protein n=1 Tax=Danionella cerebrum TaxID=2873325 RepID=A0A553QQP8_9TELE|nr:hypothetical protein DNTS_029275 [Danionella translucida]